MNGPVVILIAILCASLIVLGILALDGWLERRKPAVEDEWVSIKRVVDEFRSDLNNPYEGVRVLRNQGERHD